MTRTNNAMGNQKLATARLLLRSELNRLLQYVAQFDTPSRALVTRGNTPTSECCLLNLGLASCEQIDCCLVGIRD